jgi:RNA polymerase sigma factor for flagellar operon FliA
VSAARNLGWERAGITPELRLLAITIARAYMKRLPRHIRLSDIEQAALTGLWDGLSRNVCDEPTQRDAYLKCRIRGSIIDELRAQDWLPRRIRRGQREATSELVVLYGNDAAEFAGSGQRWEDRLPDRAESAEARLLRLDQGSAMERAIATLPWRMQRILRLHYQRGVKFLKIAEELGVSEPRISQLHARAIERVRAALKDEEAHEHRGIDRGAGDPAEEDPGTGTFPRRIPSRGLGGPTAAAAHRPVPAGAGGAELHRAPRPRSRRARTALRAPGAAAEPGDGGVAVSAPEAAAAEPSSPEPGTEEPNEEPMPVPSVLPEAGIDLKAELLRYQAWMIEQALLRTGGNQSAAGLLLGYSDSAIYLYLKRRAQGASPRGGNRAPRTAAGESLAAAAPSSHRPPPPPPTAAPTLADRIDWDRVALLRAGGLCESLIAQKIGSSLGVNRFLVEKVLRRHPAAAAAE